MKRALWNDPAVTETLNIFQQMHDGGYLLEGARWA